MAKMDVRQAYRNIPVASEDKYLSIGITSAPLLFSAIVDALLYIMLKTEHANNLHRRENCVSRHYIDILWNKLNVTSNSVFHMTKQDKMVNLKKFLAQWWEKTFAIKNGFFSRFPMWPSYSFNACTTAEATTCSWYPFFNSFLFWTMHILCNAYHIKQTSTPVLFKMRYNAHYIF